MYSVVLLAALASATDMPDFGRRGGCCGCYGGYGGGGWGGCYGGYGWGGWGGGYGGWGGGYGGWGGGYGGWGGGGYAYAPALSTYASPVMLASNPIPATTLATRSMYYSPNASANRRANIIVHLPENAELMVDGKRTASTSGTRRFHSPPLEAGKDYHYVFVARMDRDGQTVTAEKRLDIRAGETRDITITLPDLNGSVERKPPTRLPAEEKGLPARRTREEAK